MGIVVVLLPLSLLLAIFGLIGFLWGVKREQFDDLQTPAQRAILDEEIDQQSDLTTNR